MSTLRSSGAALNFTDTGGAGPPLLLIHALGFHSGMWHPQVSALGEATRVIAVDLKGCGGSRAPTDLESYSMEAYAGELSHLVQDLMVAPVILAGLAMGGWVAMAFVHRYPELVAALVLADTRPDAETPEGRAKRSEQQEVVRQGGARALTRTWDDLLISEGTRRDQPELTRAIVDLLDPSPQGLIGGLEATKNRPDMTGQLQGIEVPTLVLVGEHDRISPQASAEQMHELIRDSELSVIPAAGTLSNLEAPSAFNQELSRFIRGI